MCMKRHMCKKEQWKTKRIRMGISKLVSEDIDRMFDAILGIFLSCVT